MAMRLRALHRQGFAWLRTATVAAVAFAAVGAGTAEAVVKAEIVVDAKTGKVLHAANADTRTYPASLTKIMTLYMLFEALDGGRTTLSSQIRISSHAAAQPPSKLGLKPGQTIEVKDAILALVTRSANDIAEAVGEHLAGSQAEFARQMTTRARQLGMKSTTFRNASGLPDGAQVTTARDMAILGRAIQDRFPHYFHYFKTTSFTYKGTKIGNHNRLLGKYPGVDGIKTGYIRASGFNLVTSVNQKDRRVVAVVMGGSSGASRDARMEQLLKAHVPKASTGRQLVARIMPLPGAVPATAFADPPPAPRVRPDGDIQTGSVQSVATIVPEEFRAQGDISDDLMEVAAEPARVVSSVSVTGWKIQIAAAPSEASALEILDRARSKGGSALSGASPYTEPVVKDSVTLYRARFAGFAGKDAARAACAHLTKQKFACYAIAE